MSSIRNFEMYSCMCTWLDGLRCWYNQLWSMVNKRAYSRKTVTIDYDDTRYQVSPTFCLFGSLVTQRNILYGTFTLHTGSNKKKDGSYLWSRTRASSSSSKIDTPNSSSYFSIGSIQQGSFSFIVKRGWKSLSSTTSYLAKDSTGTLQPNDKAGHYSLFFRLKHWQQSLYHVPYLPV